MVTFPKKRMAKLTLRPNFALFQDLRAAQITRRLNELNFSEFNVQILFNNVLLLR